MHLQGRPSNYLFQLFFSSNRKEDQIKTVAFSQLLDHVYGACIPDAFGNHRIGRYSYINTHSIKLHYCYQNMCESETVQY